MSDLQGAVERYINLMQASEDGQLMEFLSDAADDDDAEAQDESEARGEWLVPQGEIPGDKD